MQYKLNALAQKYCSRTQKFAGPEGRFTPASKHCSVNLRLGGTVSLAGVNRPSGPANFCQTSGMLLSVSEHCINLQSINQPVEICPITLAGKHVRLEPLTPSHENSLIEAASDGELWKSTVTTVPSHTNMASYIQDALHGQSQGVELPFAIIQKALDKVVGTTRFYEIRQLHRGVAIGYTWLAASVQRTAVNTEAKLLMLTHAFENWRCIRVEFMTHVLNKQSREAILRLGAKEEAILRSHMIMPDGRVRDSVCFSIILEEWPEVKARLVKRLSTQ